MTGAQELVLGEFSEPELQQLVEKSIDAFAAAHPSPVLTRGRKELFAALVKKYRRSIRTLAGGRGSSSAPPWSAVRRLGAGVSTRRWWSSSYDWERRSTSRRLGRVARRVMQCTQGS